jgi:signal transduction histidine kinase
VERERSTAHVADLVWGEQQALLHTLHDSLGQTLTGLGMLSAGLSQRLTADRSAAETAQQIAQQAQLALEEVRRLCHGLFPGEIDAKGLVPALRALAATIQSLHQIDVQVEGAVSAPLLDGRVATQLYRIAQEAVTNAVKHGRPRQIQIQLLADPGMTKLCVTDNGVGIDIPAPKHNGLGLRIMRYRATSIGAHLSIERRRSGGTEVTCTLRDMPLSAGLQHVSGADASAAR